MKYLPISLRVFFCSLVLFSNLNKDLSKFFLSNKANISCGVFIIFGSSFFCIGFIGFVFFNLIIVLLFVFSIFAIYLLLGFGDEIFILLSIIFF